MIKRAHIHQFLAVVETGSFTLAAQRIRVTQPTLSVGIAELERLIGKRLFVRDKRHIRITDAGAQFLIIARDLQKGFRAADAFGNAPQKAWPQLRLGVLKTLSPMILKSIVEMLGYEFSMEIIDGSDSDLRTAMSNGRIDVAIGLLNASEPSTTVIPLWQESYVMLVADNHRFAATGHANLSELGTEIMIARRTCEVLDQTSRIFTKHGIRPRFSFRSESDEKCLIMVAAGIGITTAPQSYVGAGITGVTVEKYDLKRQIGVRIEPTWLTPSKLARLEAMFCTWQRPQFN